MTGLSAEAIAALGLPLNPDRVTTMKAGPSTGVPYLETWDCILRANEIFGHAGWSFEVIGQPWVIEKGKQGGNHTAYEVWAALGKVTVGEATYSDIGTNVRNGAGSGGLEMAVKGAVSDALKRCLRMLGDQFGLVLYDKSVTPQDLRADWMDANGGVAQSEEQGRHQVAGSSPAPATQSPVPLDAQVSELGGLLKARNETWSVLKEVIVEPFDAETCRAVVGRFMVAKGLNAKGVIARLEQTRAERLLATAQVAAQLEAEKTNDDLLEEEIGRRGIKRGDVARYIGRQANAVNVEAWCKDNNRTGRELGEFAWEASRQAAAPAGR